MLPSQHVQHTTDGVEFPAKHSLTNRATDSRPPAFRGTVYSWAPAPGCGRCTKTCVRQSRPALKRADRAVVAGFGASHCLAYISEI